MASNELFHASLIRICLWKILRYPFTFEFVTPFQIVIGTSSALVQVRMNKEMKKSSRASDISLYCLFHFIKNLFLFDVPWKLRFYLNVSESNERQTKICFKKEGNIRF